MRCSLQVLCEITGLGPNTIKGKVDAEGFPFVKRPVTRNESWEFETIDVIEYLKTGAGVGTKTTPLKDAQTREAIAAAGLKELDLAERQGQLVDYRDIFEPVMEALGVVKSLIGAIPGRMAQTLAAESDPARVQVMLRDEINAALTGLNAIWAERK